MHRAIRLFLPVAATLFSLVVFASASVVLSDGQVIKGSAVVRDGDSYVVTMAGGNKVAFPVALVKEIRIEDDAAPKKTAYGIDVTKPKTLAGPAKRASQDSKDQLKVFGPPTQWSNDAVDTRYYPKDPYDASKDVLAGSRSTWIQDIIGGTWKPTESFDVSKDVLAGSRSTWTKDAVDTTWKPSDGWGFKPLAPKGDTTKTIYPMDFAAPYSPASDAAIGPAGPTPWSCGEKIFASDSGVSSIRVQVVSGSQYKALGIPLYEADATVGTTPRKAIFTIAGGECRLVGGDADAILGLNLTPDHTMSQDAASFNAALAARGGAAMPTGAGKLDYAFSFVSLTDPSISGSSGATLTLISNPEELDAIAGKISATCTLAKARRRKEARTAASAFSPPKIVAGKDGDVATFLTWSSATGAVTRNEVVMARSGVITAKRQAVASHVGDHKD